MVCDSKNSFQPEVLGSQFSGRPKCFIQDTVYNIFRLSACSIIAIFSRHRLIQRLRRAFNET